MRSNEHSAIFRLTHTGIQATSTVKEAIEVFQTNYRIHFVTYHLRHTVASAIDTPFVRTTYPDAWVARYLLSDYVKIDPILHEGMNRQLPFEWREVEVPEAAYEFCADAQRHGVGENGYSIPIVTKTRRALLSLNTKMGGGDWSKIVSDRGSEWAELAFTIHEKAVLELHDDYDPIPLLGSREVECLHWSALGKDSKDIAAILGLSNHTVKSYLKSARFKLGCATISAATARAAHLRLIQPPGSPGS